MNEILFAVIWLAVSVTRTRTLPDDASNFDLSPSHLPYYFNTYKHVLGQYCDHHPDYSSCNGNGRTLNSCWGYEVDCDAANSYPRPVCPGDHNGWVKSKKEQLGTFYKQGDFGFVRDQRYEMMVMCEPSFKDDSSLECSDHMRFCRGRNILMNFTRLERFKDPIRYKMDVLKDGEIGGFCDLHKTRLQEVCDHQSPLQSWGPELQHFTALRRRPIPQDCDIVVEEPTFVMKIDAVVNMYHHFCDFFNLYASLHVNSSHESTFSTDVRILVWESYTYQSAFASTFEAFTRYPIWDLKHVSGKTVCFKNLVFPLLPRMIFGLYYNTPLINGCERSGLFRAFSEHVLHRLRIPLHSRTDGKVRVTFLSRDTMFRKVLNERQLLSAISGNADYEVRRVIFDRNVSFKNQLEIIRNTDVLISMHGAGLTHLLFLPDWAVVFELYNCEDPNCYKDLARLRGVKYITWYDEYKISREQTHDTDKRGHAKFMNYKFDADEFVKLVNEAAEYVRKQDTFPGNNVSDRDEL